MPLVRNDYEVPLTAGINSFGDPKKTEQALLTASNVYRDKAGRIAKRPGFERVSSSRTVTGDLRDATSAIRVGNTLVPTDSGLMVLGRDYYSRTVNGISNVYSNVNGPGAFLQHEDAADTDWDVVGNVESFDMSVVTGPSSSVDYPAISVARIGDIEMWAWIAAGEGSTSGYGSVKFIFHNAVTDVWFGEEAILLGGTKTGADAGVFVGVIDATLEYGADIFGLVYWGVNTPGQFVGRLFSAAGVYLRQSPPVGGTTDEPLNCAQIVADDKETICTISSDGANVKLSRFTDAGVGGSYSGYTTSVASDATDQLAVGKLDDDYIVFARVTMDGAVTLHSIASNFSGATPVLTSTTMFSGAPGTAILETGPALYVLGGPHGDDSTAGELAYSGTAGTHSAYVILSTGVSVFSGVATHVHGCTLSPGTPSATAFTYPFQPIKGTAGRPFIRRANMYFPLYAGNTEEHSAASAVIANKLLLVGIRGEDTIASPDLNAVGRTLYLAAAPVVIDAGGHQIDSYYSRMDTWTDSAGTIIAGRRQARIVGVDSEQQSPIVQHAPVGVYVTLDSTFAQSYPLPSQYVRSGKDIIIGGPVLKHFDGLCQELGFPVDPELWGVTGVEGGALAGTYSGCFMHEWIDRLGQRHRSIPSETASATLTEEDWLVAGSRASLLSQPFRDPNFTAGLGTDKHHRTGLPRFRTVDSGSSYFRHETAPLGLVSSLSYDITYMTADDDADADIQDNEQLYTDAGIVPISFPPGADIVLAHKDRVFIVPIDNPTKLWPSHKRVAGVGLTFSANLALSIPDGGDTTALGGLDDYVIVFKNHKILAFGGDGPNEQNIGSFSEPQEIASDVGCRERNSVVTTPAGLMFKSHAGWQLLTRSLEVLPIGLPADAYDDYSVRRAFIVPWLKQVRIVHGPRYSDGSVGSTHLVYDYLDNAWSTIISSKPNSNLFVDGCAVDGVVYYMDTGGTVYKETDDSTYADGYTGFTADVSSIIHTNWITNDVVDFARVWKVKISGEFQASGNVFVDHYFDYGSSTIGTNTIDVTTIGSDGTFDVRPPRGACKAYRCRVRGAFVNISKIVVEFGKQAGRAGRSDTVG